MAKILAVLAVITFGLTIFNSVIEWQIEDEKLATKQRDIYVSQGANVVKINSELINALAAKAAQKNDVQITDLLAEQGVTFTVNPRIANSKQ